MPGFSKVDIHLLQDILIPLLKFVLELSSVLILSLVLLQLALPILLECLVEIITNFILCLLEGILHKYFRVFDLFLLFLESVFEVASLHIIDVLRGIPGALEIGFGLGNLLSADHEFTLVDPLDEVQKL